jgi:cytoskeleton protein RodZ
MSAAEAEVTELPASPGARLRREREVRGLSQQQAADTLNLDPTIVTCLEANDFAALGAPVFAKGHLRRYAALLGLSEDEIVAAYERSKLQVQEPTLVPKSRLEMSPARGKPRWPWVMGGVVSFLVAAALIGYLSENGLPWVDGTDEPSSPPVPAVAPASEQRTPDVASAPAAAPASGVGAVVPAGSTPSTVSPAVAASDPASPAPALQPGQVSLQLRFSADSWVEVFDGAGKAVIYDLGKAGSERTVTGTAPLSVTIGNVGAVAVAINGRPVAVPPRAPGELLARFSIGPDGSLR